MFTHDVALIPDLSSRDLARFNAKFVRGQESDCWPWIAAADSNGYGRFSLKSKGTWCVFLSHRVSWKIYKGRTDLFVLHRCDNPRCINPNHLFDGDQKDNMSDCARKGRAVGNRGLVVGEKHGMHKLTWSIVGKI